VARDGFKIIVPKQWQRWSLGARAMKGGFLGPGNRQFWELANEFFYAETQRLVHVISGDLKASGREEVHLEGVRVVGAVAYGDEQVVYAQYEIDRGGDHDFMGRAWEQSQATFQAVFGKSWDRVVAAWS
jgi:hypothetical protein